MKINIEIPESINDITLAQYQKFYAIYDKEADSDFISRKALDIFYGIDVKNYNRLKVKDVEHITGELNKALSQKITLIRRFKLNNVEYGFVPDLDDITFGEFVDLDNNGGLDKMHRLMSILYRPITDESHGRYRIKPYSGTNERLTEMPLGIALSAMDFFFDIGIQLTSATLNSLTPKDSQMKQKLDLAKSGLGILQSTPYRMGIYQSSMKS